MTPDAVWKRYAAIWSLAAAEREMELAVCLAGDATYCDPNGPLTEHAALPAYMGRFQDSVPGARLHIRSVLHHHDQSLANWILLGIDGTALQAGTSFGILTKDGRLGAISGFFDLESRNAAA